MKTLIVILFFIVFIYSLCRIRKISDNKAEEIFRNEYSKRNDLKGGDK